MDTRQRYHFSAQKPASNTFEILDLDIDPSACGDACCGSQLPLWSSEKKSYSASMPLYKYSEIPDFMKGNSYIINGYRGEMNFNFCIKSLFVWSNEMVNIWSHLLGFILFVVIAIYDNLVVIPDLHGSVTDHLFVTIALVCFQFCLLCSSGYHLFMCHSERANKRWLSLDLTGISVGIIGVYVPGVHYAFYCLSLWRDIYIMIIACLFAMVLYYQMSPRFHTESYFVARLLVYSGLVAYGVIPTSHWVYLNGGFSSEIVQLFVPKVAGMYIITIFAFVFYITKFPECYFPGIFDYIGSSHQWWHIIIMLAFYWWHKSGLELMTYRNNNPCLS